MNTIAKLTRARWEAGPRDAALDSTVSMWLEGYPFIWNRCRRLETDVFSTRILGRRAFCIHGREAAALFYDETKFERHGALPRRVITSLFGKRAVHTLDGTAHKNRKAAFLSLMTPASLERLTELTVREWQRAARRWEEAEVVVLFDEVAEVLTRSTCEWAEIPLSSEDVPRRARDFVRMVEAFGGVGPRLWRGKAARIRTERWMQRIVAEARRKGSRTVRRDSALDVMSRLRRPNGKLLDSKVAAVELINVIRPTVAVAWFVTFAALALHDHPEVLNELRSADGESSEEYMNLFVQEVRRFYPFVPYLGARVRADFDWKGHHFDRGMLVLLDVYGANHDPRIWKDPDSFAPERFRKWHENAFDFIPQGGGPRTGHRCPGEWITMNNVALAVDFLARRIRYDVVAPQDLGYDLARMPTRPRSGFRIENVRTTAALHAPVPWPPGTEAAIEWTTGKRPMHS